MSKYYDQRHSEMSFRVGEHVMLRTRHLSLGVDKSRKLAPRWIGSFLVAGIEGPLTYRLNIPDKFNSPHPVYHVSNLENYHSPDVAQGQTDVNKACKWYEKVTSCCGWQVFAKIAT